MSQIDLDIGNDDSEMYNDGAFQWGGRDATIFLIDSSNGMFSQSNNGEEIAFSKALSVSSYHLL